VVVVAAAIALALAFFLARGGAEGAAATTSILDHSVKPATPVDPDRAGVELGVKFVSKRAGTITSIQFYRSSAQKRAYTGTVWSASGAKLATASFPASTRAGWQTAKLNRPVAVSAGQKLVASYYTPAGAYAATEWAFTKRIKRNGFRVPVDGGVYRYGSASGFPTESWHGSNYFVDVVFHRRPSVPRPSGTPTKPKPSATSVRPTPSPTSTPKSGFPSERTTGVPAGTKLTAYTGPCTITAANTVIDAKAINCSLDIQAQGVVISRSKINGTVANDWDSTASFTIRDSEVNAGNNLGTGIGNVNYTALRVHVTGGNRSMNCDNACTIRDSYVHGQFRDDTGLAHESGIRMSNHTVLRHNTIACDAPDVPPDAGCSADLTGYGDFAVVENNLIERNLFKASTGGYCAYGGSSPDKPYSNGVNNISFLNNVFERGENGKCGVWGPITSFDSEAPGNTWSGNVWGDGGTVPPAN